MQQLVDIEEVPMDCRAYRQMRDRFATATHCVRDDAK
jgi:hypothetical protein